MKVSVHVVLTSSIQNRYINLQYKINLGHHFIPEWSGSRGLKVKGSVQQVRSYSLMISKSTKVGFTKGTMYLWLLGMSPVLTRGLLVTQDEACKG